MTHKMQVCDRSGHTTMTWTDDQTVMDAEFASIVETFNKRVAQGFLATRTDEKGQNEEQIKTFDPTAPKIVLTPPLVGG